MKRLPIVILVCAIAAPAAAREKCTSMCHFFEAWALTQTCRNLALNDEGRQTDKDFGDLRSLKRQAINDIKRQPDACKIDCKWNAEAPDVEGTACQYLKLR